MKFSIRRPKFDEVDNEYVIPIRLSEEVVHNLLAGWTPIGFGWGHLRGRDDGSFDLFVRQANISEDLNLVKLDLVQSSLMASLDLAQRILTLEDWELDDELKTNAEAVVNLIANVAKS